METTANPRTHSSQYRQSARHLPSTVHVHVHVHVQVAQDAPSNNVLGSPKLTGTIRTKSGTKTGHLTLSGFCTAVQNPYSVKQAVIEKREQPQAAPTTVQ